MPKRLSAIINFTTTLRVVSRRPVSGSGTRAVLIYSETDESRIKWLMPGMQSKQCTNRDNQKTQKTKAQIRRSKAVAP
ncbi:uncharacterized protein ANIA_10727 [Aspergillus nidulans FGSC A4]|uniref:Uncharacterized protein n=1 Tax=Emericella nidulans (strain FGSC A4 / ATCC 38163 / CBS 112.46 / NRRL 194 / M139) TaxID=227321 RepID=C8VFI1_EMENI|nr:hypothetical protein [Aspergillus nidulans FGSC A4]CBF81265.1 TPA: hypothetical protein ANIA_10727 [Aspergillus nidulans FGSC A4]